MPSIELYFGDQDLGKYKIVKDETTVGRDPTADVVIDNLGISRIHCRYVKRNNIYAVEDNESSNGTFVNGKRVVSHNLNEGDEVVIGKYRMIFHYHSDQGEVADQGTQAVAGGGTMPDTLKTYVMDGKSIRDQLKQMEEKGGGAEGVSAADYAEMMDPLKPRMPATQRQEARQSGGLMTFLYLSLAANVLLLVAIVVLGVLFVMYVLPALNTQPREKPAVEATEEPAAEEDTGAEEEEIVDDLLRDL